MRARLEWAREVRGKGGVTVPTTIAEEKATNIFLRCSDAGLCEQHNAATPAEAFAKIRKAKDGTMKITAGAPAPHPLLWRWLEK